MIKRKIILTAFILFCLLPLSAQVKKQESGLKREVTLYNPYKPSLPESRKRSFLPDMNDTMKIKPDFRYDVNTKQFMPVYTISPIKAAALLPDPIPKLYKSYINAGMGNYLTPLAEISITNERSKKGAIGFYGRHFSTNGKIKLQNDEKVFAGYMDNDASLFGKKIFKKSVLNSSVDFSQKVRYAYGYDPAILDYSPDKKDIRSNYNSVGAKASLSSLTTDSARFYYNFDTYYNFFSSEKNYFQHSAGIKGIMAKSFKGFYVGSGISLDYYKSADSISTDPDYIFSISPFLKKSNDQWAFKLGFEALLDRVNSLHFYPDITFDIHVVPSYVTFFSALSGKLERNLPAKIINENPYIISTQFPDLIPNFLYKLPDTDHSLIVSAGLKGNTGIGGNYLMSASYSIINTMLFYSNLVTPALIDPSANGNYFIPVAYDGNLFNLHGELSQAINDKLSISGQANYYNYSIGDEIPWNKPKWDGNLYLKYNLRNKIIAGIGMNGIGKRSSVINGDNISLQSGFPKSVVELDSHFNINLSAEYRYSNILSFWLRFDNIAFNKYYEWAYYPTQRFLGMIGFTYSL
jgi:hypothetical protein